MPQRPSLPWRITSSAIFGVTSAICRSFLHGLNDVEVVGLDSFLKVLDRRKDAQGRTRGLVTGMSILGRWRPQC
jgi:monolysocardiolipin acyltransferase